MSAFRALRQVALSSSRLAGARQLSCRATVLTAFRSASVVPLRTFSVSTRRFGQGTTDVGLSQKLQEELNYEKGANAQGETPGFLKAFQTQGVWEIEDIAGNDEVTLTRTFGNETLRLMFSIAELPSEEEDFTTDEESSESRDAEDDSLHQYPIRVSLSITKTTVPGAVNIDMIAQEGQLILENVSFYKDAKLATELTAESDWKRRGLYVGPQFDTLDVSLQEEIEKYLAERGVDEQLAMFIPEYSEYKEQNEYVKWLENVKTFVDQ